jgi:hypothetical protein
MTIIFWHKNRLYADTNIVKGSESFDGLSKINGISKPFRVKSKKLKINDVIYGWVASGAIPTANQLMRMLRVNGKEDKDSNLDTTVLIYEMASSLDLLNEENNFEVILIGSKANYSIDIDAIDIFKVYKHSQNWGIGSGREILQTTSKKFPNFDPIRMMYQIFSRDSGCGGMVDVWELTTGRRPSFQRVGLCRGIEGRNVNQLLTDMSKKYEFDWIVNPNATPPKIPYPKRKVVNPQGSI